MTPISLNTQATQGPRTAEDRQNQGRSTKTAAEEFASHFSAGSEEIDNQHPANAAAEKPEDGTGDVDPKVPQEADGADTYADAMPAPAPAEETATVSEPNGNQPGLTANAVLPQDTQIAPQSPLRRSVPSNEPHGQAAGQPKTSIAPRIDDVTAPSPGAAQKQTATLAPNQVASAFARITDTATSAQNHAGRASASTPLADPGLAGPSMPTTSRGVAYTQAVPVGALLAEAVAPLSTGDRRIASEVSAASGIAILNRGAAQQITPASSPRESLLLRDSKLAADDLLPPTQREPALALPSPVGTATGFYPSVPDMVGSSTSATVRVIAQQMADALPRQPDRLVEIALNPEELGRVRMSLSMSDAGVTLVVGADRPETLDLMRRHIALLGEQFRDLGYEDINFQFDQRGQDQQHRSDDVTHQGEPSEQPQPAKLPTSDPPKLAASGLDMRL